MAGGFAKAVFRVPSESETASTVKLSVPLPRDHPFAHVTPGVIPGWKVASTSSKLPKPVKVGDFTLSKAVTRVTWTAVGKGVPAGQFEEFALSLGTLPTNVSEVAMPAVQTYSDGEVVHWNQPAPATGDEPEHPAPALHIVAADQAGAAAQSTPAADTKPAVTASHPDGTDETARVMGGIGVLLAAAALILTGLRRRAAQR